ncbi:MAG: hypothetical protein HYV07_33145 [Deltaproteobacteria bacterium]|nr:hypothetical protein [Deltaproteobacteria bacterium]
MAPLLLLLMSAPPGTLQPAIRGSGCSYVAVPAGGAANPTASLDGGSLELPPGTYGLRVTCEELTTFVPGVKITSGKVARPKVRVEAASFRVLAKKGSALRPGTARIYPVGGPYDSPLSEHPVNQKFTAAAGKFDLVVNLADEASEVRLDKVEINAKKTRTVEVSFGPGKVLVEASENEKKATAIVRLFRPGEPSPSAEGSAGTAISVPPGRYAVETSLPSAADFRVHRQEVWVTPKKTAKISARFATGVLELELKSDGRTQPALVRLRIPGAADFFNYFHSPGSVVLTPGKYDAILEPENLEGLKQHEALGLVVRPNETTRTAIDLTPATVTFEVRQDGVTLPVSRVELFTAGGGELSLKPNADGEYRLWPGRYEFVAHLGNGRTARDGPFGVELGSKIARVVEFSVGTLVVRPERDGKLVAEATVQAFRPGAKDPLAKGSGLAELTLPPGTYDVKVASGSTSAWKESVRIEAKKKTSITVALVAASGEEPSGDAPEAPLPEGDAP